MQFPERPLMTRLHRIPSDFCTPKVRDSFVSKFVYDTEELDDMGDGDDPGSAGASNPIVMNHIGSAGGGGGGGGASAGNSAGASAAANGLR